MSRRQFLALILPLLAVLIGFVALFVLERTGAVGAPPWDSGFARYVRTTLADEYVGGVDDEEAWKAYFAGLNAYVRHFDQYAEVVPPWKVAEQRERSSGRYGGIGVRTVTPPNWAEVGVTITGVAPDGPAMKAGVKVGEAITAVSGKRLGDLGAGSDIALLGTRLAEQIKGEEGSTVSLTIRSVEGAEREVKAVRDQIRTTSVLGTRMVDEPRRIGYVRISEFVMDTAEKFRTELEKLRADGATAVVVDLRFNSGGILPQAVSIADALLDSGIIVNVRGRSDDFNESIRATKERTVDGQIPVALLLNRYSASASEILAGALQDHRRAVLVGERTWGKFLVQTVEHVPMDKGTALFKRTFAIYETPLGHNYQRRPRDIVKDDPLAGLQPDLLVPISGEEFLMLQKRLEEEYFADWNPGQELSNPEFVDRSLEAAITVLKGETYYPRVLTK
ncbi:MAG: S41 family peptidase [Planctomycetota bacterium]|jgi:carboxyl-terminal processing protease